MSNYIPITTFAAKDALTTGSPSKVIYGADVDAELVAIQTAIASKLDDNNTDTATLGTVTATTSGNDINIIGISSSAKEITITFWGVSVSGTGLVELLIGDSGGIETSGYVSVAGQIYNTNQLEVDSTYTGSWPLSVTNGGARALYGSVTLTLHNSSNNRWVINGMVSSTTGTGIIQYISGGKALSGTLDRIRLSTSSSFGWAFDAGAINILVKY